MTDVNISMTIQEMAAALANLSANFREQAVPIALNDMAKQCRTQASRKIRETYNIKSATLKKNLEIKVATKTKLTASVVASVGSLPMIAFTPSQNKSGVGVTIKKGERKTVKHAFITTMPSGHVGVFSRYDGKGNVLSGAHRGAHGSALPIKELYTIGPSRAFASDAVQSVLQNLINAKFAQILEGKIQYLLKRQRVQEERDAGF